MTEPRGKDRFPNPRLANQRRIAFEIVEKATESVIPKVNFPKALNRLFRRHPNFGSRDRRLYREIVYTYLRYQPWLDSIKGDPGELIDHLILLANPTKEVSPLFPTLDPKLAEAAGTSNRYRQLGKQPENFRDLLPKWMLARFSRDLDDIDWQRFFSRPPIWLRCSSIDPKTAAARLKEGFPDQAENIHLIPEPVGSLSCPSDLPVKQSSLFEEGSIEIQDVSSQALLQLLNAPVQGRWFDACAGAGGKTLQLSQMLGKRGNALAYDKREEALAELAKRAQRNRCQNIKIAKEAPESEEFDGVLVDAPCSGSGTWRRHPYLMRQTTEAMEIDFVANQRRLLKRYARNVRDGGLLVYCTCSLSKSENEEVSEAFLDRHSEFAHFPLAERFGLHEESIGITVYPQDFDGDGLYIASFRRKAR